MKAKSRIQPADTVSGRAKLFQFRFSSVIGGSVIWLVPDFPNYGNDSSTTTSAHFGYVAQLVGSAWTSYPTTTSAGMSV
jgi:hypothetical protein